MVHKVIHSIAAVAAITLTTAAHAADATKGKAVFQAQCAMCHQVKPKALGIGPSLAGIVGRKAGTLPGFAYSPAMKKFAKPWTAALLDSYAASPMKAVPGNRMPFAGLADAAKRADLVAYLATLK
ncbi:MAG: c-type cytochrome [Sphingomonadaceae bacterium]|jgi:cytochrome c2